MVQRGVAAQKRAAMELSISTVVVIVLAMAMLILGLVLVKNIFTGSIYNVDRINDQVKAEIDKLFIESGDQKILLFLSGNLVEIKQGKSHGVAFGIRNTEEGTASAGNFAYRVEATEVHAGCQLTTQQAESYIRLGRTGTFQLLPGKIYYDVTRISPPSTAPLCEIKYRLSVTKDGQPYDYANFIVQVK